MIENVISELKGFRDHVEIEFQHWFKVILREVNAVPSVPRLNKNWSWFRPNVENDGLLSYYKRSLAILLLDNRNSSLDIQRWTYKLLPLSNSGCVPEVIE